MAAAGKLVVVGLHRVRETHSIGPLHGITFCNREACRSNFMFRMLTLYVCICLCHWFLRVCRLGGLLSAVQSPPGSPASTAASRRRAKPARPRRMDAEMARRQAGDEQDERRSHGRPWDQASRRVQSSSVAGSRAASIDTPPGLTSNFARIVKAPRLLGARGGAHRGFASRRRCARQVRLIEQQ